MIRTLLILSLSVATFWGQTQGTAPPAQAQPITPATPQTAPKAATATPETGAGLLPTDPVITVNGVCNTAPRRTAAGMAAKKTAAGTASTGPCRTVVTKAQFERIVDALNSTNQTIPPAMRRNLAQAYAELLAFGQAAEKAGVDKDPRFAELMRLVRLRTLADFYRRSLEEKNRNASPQEIQSYYNQNLPKYEEIKLSRIFIPAKNPGAATKDDWEKKAAETANELHDRAVKGEDFEKLQKEAYTTLGLTINPPSTTVGTRRRGMLTPQEEQELFALKPGEVSKVEQEPAGYIIYKVESKQTLPLEQVKDEISREIFRQKMEAQMKSVNAGVKADLNDKYFGPAGAPPTGPVSRPQPPGAVEPRQFPPATAPKPSSTPAAPAATPTPTPAPSPTPTPSQGQTPPK
jgi:parvulin-like peptidyl-prolyl isomerase